MNQEPNHLLPLPTSLFVKRLVRNMFFGFLIIVVSLAIGMIGYHRFEKMTWVDAYANAAMILSGMGPLQPMETNAGKIFAGTYALFSGIVFLVLIAIIFAPVVKHFLHKFHLQEDQHK